MFRVGGFCDLNEDSLMRSPKVQIASSLLQSYRILMSHLNELIGLMIFLSQQVCPRGLPLPSNAKGLPDLSNSLKALPLNL